MQREEVGMRRRVEVLRLTTDVVRLHTMINVLYSVWEQISAIGLHLQQV